MSGRGAGFANGLEGGWASVPSDAHRARNEDAFFAVPERGFFGVFDGMGGLADADVASRIAADEVQDTLAPLAPDVSTEAIADTLRDAFFTADRAIGAEGYAQGSDPRGMGTTAVVAVIQRIAPESWSAIISWVGDSRALLVPHGSESLLTLTLDDSAVRLYAQSVAQARKVQAVLGTVTDQRVLSLRERNLFLERHVLTQSLGTSLRHVHMTERTLGPEDRLLLVSDGVSDNLTDVESAALVRHASSAAEGAHALVRAARARSRDRAHLRAKPDDMTAIVVHLQ